MKNQIQLLNPDPSKKGAMVNVDKYEIVKETILHILSIKESITFKELMKEVSEKLSNSFDGSPSWYCTAVKLDLEARKIIQREKGASPQRLSLMK